MRRWKPGVDLEDGGRPRHLRRCRQACRVTGDHRRVVGGFEELYERWARLAEEAEPEA